MATPRATTTQQAAQLEKPVYVDLGCIIETPKATRKTEGLTCWHSACQEGVERALVSQFHSRDTTIAGSRVKEYQAAYDGNAILTATCAVNLIKGKKSRMVQYPLAVLFVQVEPEAG